MKVIGLTGPTGAGKTEVARRMGCPVVDADQVARRVHKDTAVLQQLCQRFGNDVALNGTLDRRLLATRAFASPQDTADLNAIMHPHILQYITQALAQLEQEGAPFCLLDAPLLFEAHCEELCHTTVAVIASCEMRKNRIVERDGISLSTAQQRMDAQPNNQYYIDRCDYVIENTGDLTDLDRSVQTVLQQIKAKFSIGG